MYSTMLKNCERPKIVFTRVIIFERSKEKKTDGFMRNFRSSLQQPEKKANDIMSFFSN